MPGKLSEPQSGTADLLRILRSSMKEIFLKLVLCLDGIKTKKALSWIAEMAFNTNENYIVLGWIAFVSVCFHFLYIF